MFRLGFVMSADTGIITPLYYIGLKKSQQGKSLIHGKNPCLWLRSHNNETPLDLA